MNQDNQPTEETVSPVDNTAAEQNQTGDAALTEQIEITVTQDAVSEDETDGVQTEPLPNENQAFVELTDLVGDIGTELGQLSTDVQEMQSSLLFTVETQANRSISAFWQGAITSIIVITVVLLTIVYALISRQRRLKKTRQESAERKNRQAQSIAEQLNTIIELLNSQTGMIQENRRITKEEAAKLESKLSDLAKLTVPAGPVNPNKTGELAEATSGTKDIQSPPIYTQKEDAHRYVNEMLQDNRYTSSHFLSMIAKLHHVDDLVSLEPFGKHSWDAQEKTKLKVSASSTGNYLGLRQENLMYVFPNRSFISSANAPAKIFDGFMNYARISMVMKCAVFLWSENDHCWVLQTKGMLEHRSMH